MDPHPAVPLTFDAVTTYGPGHWESHAKRCVETFREFWPSDIPLRTYVDSELEEQSPWLSEFKQRHRHRPTDNYRFDAVRFAHKVAAIELAFVNGTADYLIWMDADCVTHAPVDQVWLAELSQGADFARLKRKNKYSECGFMMFRRSEMGAMLVRSIAYAYAKDAIFEEKEWHDSWIFDVYANSLDDDCRFSMASLSGNAEHTSHPLVNGPLGARLDHLKGKRKAEGRSRPSDLIRPRTEAHWNG